ncbi:MAG TPA: ATP-binding cassette domain-containing protein, partial [Gemmatimonadales bacterium]|nr:ATP-binding cassette domain-containing protein [Gemmatimonadales bacterium]
MTAPLVRVENLVKHYPGPRSWLGLGKPRGTVRAVDGVTFEIPTAKTLGLVGESGSGKTTVARTLLRLTEPTSGTFRLGDDDVFTLPPTPLRRLRRRMQIVFQDPYSSLNPRMTVRQTLAEPLLIHQLVPKPERSGRVAALLEEVGLDTGLADRYPHEL